LARTGLMVGQARLIELDPTYCDVTVRRFQDYAGKPAVLEGDGRTLDAIRGASLDAQSRV
jgi:hypothetical protein